MVDPDRYMQSSRVPTANYGEIKATTRDIRDTGTRQWNFAYQQFRMAIFVTNNLVLIVLKRVWRGHARLSVARRAPGPAGSSRSGGSGRQDLPRVQESFWIKGGLDPAHQ